MAKQKKSTDIKKQIILKSPPKQKAEKNKINLYSQLDIYINTYIDDLECIREMFEDIVPVLEKKDKERNKLIQKKLKNMMASLNRKKKSLKNTPVNTSEVIELVEIMRKSYRANKLFKEHAIVMLISCYDSFISNLIKIIYLKYPDRLKSTKQEEKKVICYEELAKMKSLKAAIENIIGKEVENIMRESHHKQIKFLEKQLKVEIIKNNDTMKRFLEIAERRNLFVHCGSRVTKQYIDNCRSFGIKLKKEIKEGVKLGVNKEYFEKACDCLFQVSIEVGQTVYRKIFSNNIANADISLNHVGYKMLKTEKWKYALVVYDYALSLPKKAISKDIMYKMFLINKCLALKWSGRTKEMNTLLESIDWSAATNLFHLSLAVLKEKYEEAETIMGSMTKKELKEESAREWPLFRKFRETKQYSAAFKKLYRKTYKPELTEAAKRKIVESEKEVIV